VKQIFIQPYRPDSKLKFLATHTTISNSKSASSDGEIMNDLGIIEHIEDDMKLMLLKFRGSTPNVYV
jgi:hypothetical protein